MDLVAAAVLALAGIFGAAVSRVLSDEFKSWNPWIVERLIRLAERKLPEEYRVRLSEEWRSHIAEIPGDMGKLIAACGFLRASRKVRGAISMAPYARVAVALCIVSLFPLLLGLTLGLMIEQGDWRVIMRVKKSMWGQEVTVWKFRTSIGFEVTGPVAYLARGCPLEELPVLFSMLSGRVRLPPWRTTIRVVWEKTCRSSAPRSVSCGPELAPTAEARQYPSITQKLVRVF
jgi:hypothetical protein